MPGRGPLAASPASGAAPPPVLASPLAGPAGGVRGAGPGRPVRLGLEGGTPQRLPCEPGGGPLEAAAPGGPGSRSEGLSCLPAAPALSSRFLAVVTAAEGLVRKLLGWKRLRWQERW